jgi:hypothetical protein
LILLPHNTYYEGDTSLNGHEKGSEYAAAFEEWARALTHDDARAMTRGGQLSRAEICRVLGFGRSVLVQNPQVRKALKELEDALRACGVLAARDTDAPEPVRRQGLERVMKDAERLKHLESEVAGLRAANLELRNRLKRYEGIEQILTSTGRLAR